MSTAQLQPVAQVQSNAQAAAPPARQEITIYDHSTLMYWWPVWAVGYLLAFLTYTQGQTIRFEDAEVYIHPSKNLGVIFTVVTVLVLLMTHATVRGVASLTVIAIVVAITFFFAYMGWWDNVFATVKALAIFMNLGFYIFFSTAVFIVWFLAVFAFDRATYWTFRPGQLVQKMVFGGGARTFDTQGMSVYKMRNDMFRHWVLGMGSGDLVVSTTGAHPQEFVLHNVMFIGKKIPLIEQLVAMKPDEGNPQTIIAGSPA
jgi:hypothetical protein